MMQERAGNPKQCLLQAVGLASEERAASTWQQQEGSSMRAQMRMRGSWGGSSTDLGWGFLFSQQNNKLGHQLRARMGKEVHRGRKGQ